MNTLNSLRSLYEFSESELVRKEKALCLRFFMQELKIRQF